MCADGPLWLAVDPGLTQVGMAVVQPRGPLAEFVTFSQCFTLRKGTSEIGRLQAVVERLRELDRIYRLERVVVELPTSLYIPRGRSMDTLKVLLAIGALVGWAAGAGLRVSTLRVEEWKGRKNHEKALSLQLAETLWPRLFFANDHTAEAALLGLAAIQQANVRAAFVLLKQGWPAEKVLAPFQPTWTMTNEDVARLEAAELGIRWGVRRRNQVREA